jgi:CRISPR-associated protein Csb2
VQRILLLTIRFHDPRYHGAGDWPPTPARLFQALVAGAARGDTLRECDADALRWLEGLAPPVIAAPPARRAAALVTYVPNNDLDAVGGHPARIGEIRTGKTIRPMLLDPSLPLLYAWTIPADAPHLPALIAIADRLYQLGRGVDMAWATAEALDPAAAEAKLAAHPGPKHRPSPAGRDGTAFACPQPGSLDSLIARHKAQATRFRPGARKGTILFVQPPKPRFRMVAYDCPPARLLFDLRVGQDFDAWPLRRVVALVEQVRDEAAQRLRKARPDQAGTIEHLLIGRGAGPADVTLRPRLIPLPSIGFVHADRAIRRLLVEVPAAFPLSAAELREAILGMPLDVDPQTGEIRSEARLVPSATQTILRHYGLGKDARPARLWRSVTPIALPGRPQQPGREGSRRVAAEAAAAAAVRQALRHAGIAEAPTVVRVQREPFASRGERAEAFAHGQRFPAATLRHVELRFAKPRLGPLLLGNGRWLGLGLFAPVFEEMRVLAFDIVAGLAAAADAAPDLASALRRAVMARIRDHTGTARLDPFFSGHHPDGEPLRDGHHRHLAFAFDAARRRLLVIAPHALEAREPFREESDALAILEAALAGLAELRAGRAGLLRLRAADISRDQDPLLGTACVWRSLTPYAPTRYPKALSPSEAIAEDVRLECRRRGWPEPICEVVAVCEGPRGGLAASLNLRFTSARSGPIALGRTAHLGGGLFEAAGD